MTQATRNPATEDKGDIGECMMIDDLQQFTRRYIPDSYHASEHS